MTISFANRDADFSYTVIYIAIITLTDQTVIFLNDQTTLVQSLYDFSLGGPNSMGKTCVCHDSPIIPPGGKVLCVGDFGLMDG